MKVYIVLITVIIIIIYILISCRHMIAQYLKYFKGELKYKKDVRENLKVDLRARLISNSTIDDIIEYLIDNLNQIGYKYKGEFILSDYLKRKLIYSKFSERSLKELFKLITEHIGITNEGIELEVKRMSSRSKQTFTGIYYEGDKNTSKRISVYINPDYSYENVLAIFIHESTHYFLLSNKIKKEYNELNEYLTDIATIFLGFGKIMLEGYKQRKKLVYESEFTRSTSGYKVGYLNYSDIKYIMKKYKKNLS